ncbi:MULTISPECIES: FAD-dependent oxidoreductase [Jannaschia]|uniref:flavin monoamine oxidase family protein n=1 Tax=Jannaschia TaxID=188905 RepID=UPI0021080262|nr:MULTISPECIES: FAD-dependent oxidoreductase [unclassified Jannaschia]
MAGLVPGAIPKIAKAKGRRAPTGFLRTNWSQDPYSRGSYSFVARGARKSHHRALGRPLNERLLFAGEATHPTYTSTVHAAYESGLFAADAVLKTDAKTIGIVGAGISGLAATNALIKQGYSVTILEARDRIGGRVWTDESLGVPLDLGASWIHGTDGNPLVSLADDVKAQISETDDSFIMRGGDGRHIPDRLAPGWLEEVLSVQHTAGASQSDINTFAYCRDSDYSGEDAVFPDGFAQVFDAFSEAIDIQFNHVIRHVRWQDTHVQLESQDGLTQTFDAVIVTVPLGVLKSGAISFDPPLSADKLTAIEKLGMGVLDKVYLLYDDVFWDKDITWIATPENGLPRGQFNQWLNLYPYIDAPVIMAFNGAQPARDLAALSDAEILERAQDTLDAAYPGAR